MRHCVDYGNGTFDLGEGWPVLTTYKDGMFELVPTKIVGGK